MVLVRDHDPFYAHVTMQRCGNLSSLLVIQRRRDLHGLGNLKILSHPNMIKTTFITFEY